MLGQPTLIDSKQGSSENKRNIQRNQCGNPSSVEMLNFVRPGPHSWTLSSPQISLLWHHHGDSGKASRPQWARNEETVSSPGAVKCHVFDLDPINHDNRLPDFVCRHKYVGRIQGCRECRKSLIFQVCLLHAVCSIPLT